MAPNHFLHCLRCTIMGSSLLTQHCPACGRQFRSRGGLTKHLNTAHPNYTDGDDISSLDKASIQFGSTHESPLRPQVACTLSSPDPLNGTKPPKKHCKFRFTFHGGFLMSVISQMQLIMNVIIFILTMKLHYLHCHPLQYSLLLILMLLLCTIP